MNNPLVKKLAKLTEKTEGEVEGVDQLIFDAFNARSMIYCLNSVPDSNFCNTSLYRLLASGGTALIVMNIGKLVDTGRRVNSVRRLWDENKEHADSTERGKIDSEFQAKNVLGPIVRYRHNLLAHNKETAALAWDEIDAALEFVIRVWHLISEQSGCPVIGPTYEFIAVSQGFTGIFTAAELDAMEKAWTEYSRNFKQWMHSPIC